MPVVHFPGKGLPVVGEWIGRANAVSRIIASPCSPTPMLIVQAGFVATPVLLWSLLKPDPKDAYLSRFGKGHKKKRRWNFNVNDIWPADFKSPPPVPGAVWAAGMFAQRIGWYFSVGDATSEFALNWASLAYQWQGCRDPSLPHCQLQMGFSPWAPGGYSQLLAPMALLGQHTFISTDNAILVPTFQYTTFTYTHNEKLPPGPFPEPAGASTYAIKNLDTGEILAQGSPIEIAPGIRTGQITGSYRTTNQSNAFGVEITHGGGWSDYDQSQFTAFGTADKSILADP